MLVCHLGRTSLSSHLERFRTSFPTESLTHHVLQNGLHRLDGLRSGNLLFQYHGLVFLDYLTVLYELFHETRLHHLTIVGNGIIESHRIDRCNLCLVADTHPG